MQSESETHAPETFSGAVPHPEWANIETTKFCNLECRMCVQYNEGSTVAGPHMEFEDFESVARAVFPFVKAWQPSVSGEPTMSRGFVDMLRLAQQYGVKAELFTNATLLSESMLDTLIPNLGSATISFDAATPETFEGIRNGAKWEVVTDGVRRLVERCRAELPADRQPAIGLNCTLMRRNIEELPDLVRFAKQDLGVDHVSCYHVFPVTDEMKGESLVHTRELARACIDRAFEVAIEIGMPLSVESLDQLTAATACSGSDREWSARDGVVEGLERRDVLEHLRRPVPRFEENDPGNREITERRHAAAAAADYPERRPGRADAPQRESIWYCDFLWNKAYVYIGGNVRACCVHEVPVMGNLRKNSFEQIWNDENYRAMRQHMVAKDPVPACKGCMHIREIKDPVEIDRITMGTAAPEPKELGPLPAALDPKQAFRRRRGEPPEFEWEAVDGVRSYTVEFSLDRFVSVLFSTAAETGGPAVRENRYRVPIWAWKEAPVDSEIFYRVLAVKADETSLVTEGSIPAER